MFLRCKKRRKDGKEHRYWSVVENRRVAGGKTVQKHLLYLGEINDSQQQAWRKSIEVFCEEDKQTRQLFLFPGDRQEHVDDGAAVHVVVGSMSLHRPRQWGACWLACVLYHQLQLDTFSSERLPPSRKGTDWAKVLQTLVCYRLIEPGSEWRLHRHWFDNSAMADLLDADFSIVQKNTLYRCHDKLPEHKAALFKHLRERWENLFNPDFEVLLYDLTSTYFECDPDYDADAPGLKRYGYSRDKRPDCLQVVIALVVTTEGLPLAYEVMPGDTSDKTTLKAFLEKIERQYGKSKRTWVMDRGIPTEEVLEQMRMSDPPVQYLVGTPRGRLNKLEASFLDKGWQAVREGIEAHIFICFLAYCLHVTLRLQLQQAAPGLTARSTLEKMASIQMIDVHLPTTDGRELRMSRHTQPLPEHQIILDKLKLKLPEQPKPRIYAKI